MHRASAGIFMPVHLIGGLLGRFVGYAVLYGGQVTLTCHFPLAPLPFPFYALARLSILLLSILQCLSPRTFFTLPCLPLARRLPLP